MCGACIWIITVLRSLYKSHRTPIEWCGLDLCGPHAPERTRVGPQKTFCFVISLAALLFS